MKCFLKVLYMSIGILTIGILRSNPEWRPAQDKIGWSLYIQRE